MTKTRTNRKPPLPRSPIQVRSRRILRPPSISISTESQPGSVMKTKSMGLEIVPEPDYDYDYGYEAISFELLEIAKMAQGKQGGNGSNFGVPLFERGRFYDEYSARRNEKLKRKQISERVFDLELELEKKTDLNLNLNLKKFNDGKCLVPIPRTPLTERRGNINSNPNPNPNPRYMLRSMTKEMKKPASLLPVGSTSSVGGDRKTVGRRRKI